ncbi:TIGR02117 family protein [Hymenobacter sp. NBH84]|uniref:TIGR02117 family protein n=1 Tax=Hymenobacter sp. NBH84 TaxID=2596915 RepID=UPI0016245453|nr:TIGR02117 family protein [Hymenobacter sp. NBH84]QNE38557.1 TIGR02117 family protein [Hymenobacter sp. NBH84]
MAATLQKIGKGIAYTGAGILGAVALYLGTSFILSRIPVGTRTPPTEGTIEAYILSNGVHTDIVLPVRTSQIDWSEFIPYTDTPASDTTMRYVGFGWGDKGFYLDTPTWADLKASTAFEAMFWLSSSAMHTTFYHEPSEGPDCVRIYLKPADYARLIEFIKTSFRYDTQGRVQHIAGHSYGRYDAFYEAKRVYNLFYTCNTWANDGLKVANQKAALWTPFDSGIFYQYQ